MPKGRHPPYLVLGRRNFARLLFRVASVDTREAQELYVRLAGSWGRIPARAIITVKPNETERGVLKMIRYPQQQSTNPKESTSNMATKNKAKVTTKKAAPVADDIDELEAELNGLEEVPDDDEETEAPEVEEEDEDEADDYSGMTVGELKGLCKERHVIGVTGKNKKGIIALLEAADAESEDEDDEEDDEEEDESIDFEAMDRSELKAYIKEHDDDAKFKTSQTDEDLREIANALEDAESDEDEDEEDDDEEDDEPVKGKKTSATKGKTGAPKKGVQPAGLKTRELPKGRLSANDVAEAAGTNALAVRNFLRSEAGQKWPKDPELGRYSFSTKQVAEIVKAMKNRPKREGTVSGEEFKARMAAGRAKKAAATTKPAAVKGKKKRTK